MAPTRVSPGVFEREAKRRLIDTDELKIALGLRHRQSVWERVRAGTLPKPLIVRENAFALWDRDVLDLPDGKGKG